ncbi:SsrA-binding protein [candidate division WWE3 bacterium RBG_19FT_COMBO_34_6]|uniref:SsrA-binding protein n=1 Tax=candidate division WWE3 bacterium RBG_19FT_COMBO_34_6 TaxID=1802612 RepID=A0A1F4UJQ0_UNCKA|nr:MAG: SsrA-binding protein [candidate division WWE3 bacterium RBG_19FT_COMBO_34_6]
MLLIKNRKALFNNELIETLVAGIVLWGYEVKAVREGNVSFEGSYVGYEGNDILLYNCNIGRYSKQFQDNSNAKRPRKLLLNKFEQNRLKAELAQKGRTAVPLSFFLKNNLIKLEFALVKGRKKYEQRQLLKKRQIEKDLARITKGADF